MVIRLLWWYLRGLLLWGLLGLILRLPLVLIVCFRQYRASARHNQRWVDCARMPLAEPHLPCRTGLLSLEPTTQAVEMEYMPTGQFLGLIQILLAVASVSCCFWVILIHACIHNLHLLSAYNTGTIAWSRQVLGSCIGVQFVHVASCSSVAVQISAFLDEWSESNIHIADDVQRQLIIQANVQKEDKVGNQLEEI